MTIDQRLEHLLLWLPLRPHPGISAERCSRIIREALIETARDQRIACAESVNNLIATDHEEPTRDRAYQAVMNTELPK